MIRPVRPGNWMSSQAFAVTYRTPGCERSSARNGQHIDRDPDQGAMERGQIVRDIACQHQNAGRNHDPAGDVVNSRLPNALDDIFDIAQRLGCFPRIVTAGECRRGGIAE